MPTTFSFNTRKVRRIGPAEQFTLTGLRSNLNSIVWRPGSQQRSCQNVTKSLIIALREQRYRCKVRSTARICCLLVVSLQTDIYSAGHSWPAQAQVTCLTSQKVRSLGWLCLTPKSPTYALPAGSTESWIPEIEAKIWARRKHTLFRGCLEVLQAARNNLQGTTAWRGVRRWDRDRGFKPCLQWCARKGSILPKEAGRESRRVMERGKTIQKPPFCQKPRVSESVLRNPLVYMPWYMLKLSFRQANMITGDGAEEVWHVTFL